MGDHSLHISQHEVIWLNISVDNASGVQGVDNVQNLQGIIGGQTLLNGL